MMEKIAFALLAASKKLHPYFQAHLTVVMTNQPIRKMINRIDAAKRLIQWQLNSANLISNIGLDQQSKPKY